MKNVKDIWFTISAFASGFSVAVGFHYAHLLPYFDMVCYGK